MNTQNKNRKKTNSRKRNTQENSTETTNIYSQQHVINNQQLDFFIFTKQ